MAALLLLILSVCVGIAGRWFGVEAFAPYAAGFFLLGASLCWYILLKRTYFRSEPPWPEGHARPDRMVLGTTDYFKALVSWFDAFKATYAVPPGLYYTGGTYDVESPLIATANYHLTVFLLLRQLRSLNVRILVVDTGGINVWCAAGKGVFSSQSIAKQVDRYPDYLKKTDRKLKLILPKLSLSGVNLRDLKEIGIRPVIGPVYARELPRFLLDGGSKDRSHDRIQFGFNSRLFTCLPGLVQYLGYSILVFIGLLFVEQIWGPRAPWGLIPITALLGTAYPLLFPYLPGHRFAVKGLWLAGFLSIAIAFSSLLGVFPVERLFLALLFTFATAIFIGLTYTGNSAVSNYSRVSRETARFLPASVLLYTASIVTLIITEVNG